MRSSLVSVKDLFKASRAKGQFSTYFVVSKDQTVRPALIKTAEVRRDILKLDAGLPGPAENTSLL